MTLAPGADKFLHFECGGEQLSGVFHPGAESSRIGVLVVVGGPQYRVGSHRQFVLLGRALAEQGVPVLRFDYRGMGDSTGAPRAFYAIDEDIRAAIGAFCEQAPDVEAIVLWGLCDGASAAVLACNADPRIHGLIALNPWVHTESSEARVRLKTYYFSRLRSADFWKKIIRLEFDWRESFKSLLGYMTAAISRGRNDNEGDESGNTLAVNDENYIAVMLEQWSQFDGESGVVLSGDDLVAEEYRDLCRSDPAWRSLSENESVQCVEIAEANHTFASAYWREQVQAQTLRWIRQWESKL